MNIVVNKIKDILLKITFIIYIIGAGIILPLCYNDGLYDLMETKAIVYFFVSLIIIVLLIVYIIISIINKDISFNKNPLLLSIFVFSMVSLLSTILSYAPDMSFFGDYGWFIGSYVISSLSIIIICLSKYKVTNTKLFIPLIVVSAIIYIVSITDAFELDILKFGIDNNYLSNHSCITLIGNVNSYVGYLSLTLPLFCGLYLIENDITKKTIFFILSILAISSTAFLKSDGIYLAIGFLSFFIIPFIFYNLERIKRFSFLLFVYSVCLIISRILNFNMDGYVTYTRKMYIIIPLLLISIYLYFFSTSTKEKKFNKYKKYIIISLETLLSILCICLLITVISNNDINWGNGRLIIWQRSFEAYKNFSIKNKLIGVGPELLYNIYSSLYDDFGYVLCSHSEIIQVLLSMGIIGFVSYILCWIFLFISFYKNKNIKIIPLYYGIICYLGQSFVNSATTLNVATLSLFIVLLFSLNDIK